MTRQRNSNNSRQKTLRRWHRWVGYGSLILVMILSLTGLVLNRTAAFNLNNIKVSGAFVSYLYGISPPAPAIHFPAAPHWISWLDSRLYLDGRLIAENTPRPIGGARQGDLIIVGSRDTLSLFMIDGTLVETMEITSLPGPISRLGRTKNDAIFIESNGSRYIADQDFLSWQNLSESASAPPSRPAKPPKGIAQKITQDYQGQGITLYRLILDIHSGRILGSFGSYLMDIAALCLIFLGITGLMKNRRNGKDSRQKKK